MKDFHRRKGNTISQAINDGYTPPSNACIGREEPTAETITPRTSNTYQSSDILGVLPTSNGALRQETQQHYKTSQIASGLPESAKPVRRRREVVPDTTADGAAKGKFFNYQDSGAPSQSKEHPDAQVAAAVQNIRDGLQVSKE